MSFMRAAVKALDLHIVLAGTAEPIWRDVRVPAGLTLPELHRVIQLAFDWEDRHLHLFRTSGPGGRERIFAGDEDTALELGMESAEGYTLEDIFSARNTRLVYEYDFGDCWLHEIEVAGHAVVPAGELVCLAGANRGPVEDSGGMDGYARLCAAAQDPAHPEHKAVQEWLYGVAGELSFDPAHFDREQVNRRLTRLGLRWSDAPPTSEEIAAVVRPVKWLLQRVGPDGLELTKDGYLRPAVVQEAVVALGLAGRVYGKGNREVNTREVLGLRRQVQEWGLLRKYKGRLLRTPAGREHCDDDEGLWRYLASRMAKPGSLGEDFLHRLFTEWLVENQLPPVSVRGEILVEIMTAEGFHGPDRRPIALPAGRDLARRMADTFGHLNIYLPSSKPWLSQELSEAGMKFLLEVQRRQNSFR